MQDVIDPPINRLTIDAEFFINKAFEFHQQGDIQDAIKYAKLAIAQEPESDRFLHVLGVFHKHNGHNEKAIPYFEKAIALNAHNFTYYFNLGIVYKEAERFEESLSCQQAALAMSPDNIPCLNELGLLQTKTDRFPEAENTLLKAHQLDRENASTCINLSHLYILKEQVREAIDFANKALIIDPLNPKSYCNIGTAFMIGNCHDQGIDYLRLSLEKKPEDAALIHQSILMNMLYADNYSPETIFNEHKKWANTYLKQKNYTRPYLQQRPIKNKTLNIGLVSSDFQNHSISHFLMPLMENIDQQNYPVTCYSSSKKTDHVTSQFKQLATHWRDISHSNDDDVRQQIKQDNIDILIDLSGHSLGNRITVFSKKPAPIQMTYLGYPFSTGLQNMDYRITDELTDPEDTTSHLHSEKCLKLSPSFLCYQPESHHRTSKTPPTENKGYTSFASFNNFSKLSTLTIQTWSKILNRVPDSRVFLKSSQTISDALKDTILSTFELNGVHHSRVILHHPTLTKEEHFLLYNQVDVCLDPFPYNGTTTTYEALFMGVPVVALNGEAHYSRVSSSILRNLTLDELVADSLNDYVGLAVTLANNTAALKTYRATLREKLLSSPLTDAKSYSKNFESLLRNAWHTYCYEQSNSLN